MGCEYPRKERGFLKIQLLKFLDRIIGTLVIRLTSPPRIRAISSSPSSILFIRPGGIGDAVLLLPAIQAVRERFPLVRITVLAEKRNGSIFRLSPAVDQLLFYDRPSDLLKAIRGKYDVAIDTEQWHRLSAGVTRFTGAPVSIGYGTNDRTKLLTHPVQYAADEYEMYSFFRLLIPLGICEGEVPSPPYVMLPEGTGEIAEALLGNCAGEVFIVIFSGASIPERRWGADRFKALAENLRAKMLPIVVIGGKEDAADGEKITEGGKYGLNLAGKTSLAETAAIIDRSTLLISGDSGILHIGVGLGKPTVSLFGPGIAEKWAPRGNSHIVLNSNLACSPCTRFGYTPKCQIDAKCMSDITVNEVVAAVEKLLTRIKSVQGKQFP